MKTLSLLIAAVILSASAYAQLPVPGTTKPSLSDTQPVSLMKINRLLDDARSGAAPLIVTGGASTSGTYSAVVTASVTVSSTATTIRAADPLAVKSVIVNTGTNEMTVLEGGGVVALLEAKQTWESSKAGILALSGSCTTDGATDIVLVSTYH